MLRADEYCHYPYLFKNLQQTILKSVGDAYHKTWECALANKEVKWNRSIGHSIRQALSFPVSFE